MSQVLVGPTIVNTMAPPVMVKVRIEILLVAGLSLIGAALLLVAFLACIAVAYKRDREEAVALGAKQKMEIIEVMESPMPTYNKSTPRSSPFMTHRKLRRAGKARLPWHRRPTTRCFDPKVPNECGYHSMLVPQDCDLQRREQEGLERMLRCSWRRLD